MIQPKVEEGPAIARAPYQRAQRVLSYVGARQRPGVWSTLTDARTQFD